MQGMNIWTLSSSNLWAQNIHVDIQLENVTNCEENTYFQEGIYFT